MDEGLAATNKARFDADAFDGLAAMVGADVLATIVTKFETELAARFGHVDAAEDTARLARDAHAMISSAGMLGFVRLIAILRRVETGSTGAIDLDGPLAELAAELRLVAADLSRQKVKLQAAA